MVKATDQGAVATTICRTTCLSSGPSQSMIEMKMLFTVRKPYGFKYLKKKKAHYYYLGSL